MEGSLAFAYKKDTNDIGPTFLFFFDAMKEGERVDLRGVQHKLKGGEMSLKEKREFLISSKDGIQALIHVCITELSSASESDGSAKIWLNFFSTY